MEAQQGGGGDRRRGCGEAGGTRGGGGASGGAGGELGGGESGLVQPVAADAASGENAKTNDRYSPEAELQLPHVVPSDSSNDDLPSKRSVAECISSSEVTPSSGCSGTDPSSVSDVEADAEARLAHAECCERRRLGEVEAQHGRTT